MLTITDRAAGKAKAILAAEGKDNWGIRIYIAEMGKCGPNYGLNLQEEHMPNDEVIVKDAVRFFIDKDLCRSLSGMQLDYHAEGQIEGFIFTGLSSSCSSGCSCCE